VATDTTATGTYDGLTCTKGKLHPKHQNAKKRKQAANPATAAPPAPTAPAAPSAPPSPPALTHIHHTRSEQKHYTFYACHTQEITRSLQEALSQEDTALEDEPTLSCTADGTLLLQYCNKAIHPDTGKLAEYRELRQSSEGAEWEQAAAEEIGRLIELGFPQDATPIQTDNNTASGIANDTVKQRRSKAMDMRFYWIRDRVRQDQFLIYWSKGSDNLADYFTKHHPVSHHRAMRPVYLHEANSLTSSCEGVLIPASGIQELLKFELRLQPPISNDRPMSDDPHVCDDTHIS
jgi:hypothetical protein